jgi:hypothetical protein
MFFQSEFRQNSNPDAIFKIVTRKVEKHQMMVVTSFKNNYQQCCALYLMFFNFSGQNFAESIWIPTGTLIGKSASFTYCLCLKSIQDIKGCKKSSNNLHFLV